MPSRNLFFDHPALGAVHQISESTSWWLNLVLQRLVEDVKMENARKKEKRYVHDHKKLDWRDIRLAPSLEVIHGQSARRDDQRPQRPEYLEVEMSKHLK